MPFDPDYDRGLQMAQKFNTGANRNPTMYNRILAGLPAAARQGFIENARSSGGSGGKQMGAHRSMRDDYLDGVVARAGMSPEEKHQSMVDAAERAKAASRAETEAEEAIRQTGLKQQEQESWQRGQDYAQDYYAQPRTGITEYQEKFQETDAAGNPIGPLQSYDRRSYKVEAYTDPKTGETRHKVVPKGSPKKRPVDKPVEETNIEEQKEVASQTVQGQANQPTLEPLVGSAIAGAVGDDAGERSLESQLGAVGGMMGLDDNVVGEAAHAAEEPRFSNVGEAAYAASQMGGIAGAVGDDAGDGLTPEQMENLSSPENIMDTLGGIGQQVIGGQDTPERSLESQLGKIGRAVGLDHAPEIPGLDAVGATAEELASGAGGLPDAGAPDDLDATLTEAGVPPEDVRGAMPWAGPVADQPGDEPFPEDLKARVLGGHSKRTDDQWKQFQKHQQREEAIHQRRRSNRAANARARNRAMTPAFQMRRFPNESDAAYAKRYAAGVQAMSGLQGAQLQGQNQLAGLGMQGETQIRIQQMQNDLAKQGIDMQQALATAGLSQQNLQNMLNMLPNLPYTQRQEAINNIMQGLAGAGGGAGGGSMTPLPGTSGGAPTLEGLRGASEDDLNQAFMMYAPNLQIELENATEGNMEVGPDDDWDWGIFDENMDEKGQDFAYNLANMVANGQINQQNIGLVADFYRRKMKPSALHYYMNVTGTPQAWDETSGAAIDIHHRLFEALLNGRMPSMGDVKAVQEYGYK